MNDGPDPPRGVYADRLAARKSSLLLHEARRDRIGLWRLFVFLAAASIAWFAIRGSVSIWWIAAPAAAFIALVSWQARVERNAECARRAIGFFEKGIARLENRWRHYADEQSDGGERFLDPHHPYAADLDLFGRGSLFALLSTARTRGGEARLAGWLKSPATPTELEARQEAIGELRPMLDLRERIAVLGEDFRLGVNPDELARWAAAPPNPFAGWMRPFALVSSVLAFGALVWYFAGGLTDIRAEIALFTIGAIQTLFAFPLRHKVLSVVNVIEEPAHDLALLSEILAALEAQHFASPRLASLRDAIGTNGPPASTRIARLRLLMELLDSRDNPVVRAIGPLVLWTTQLGMALESWRAQNGSQVSAWLDAVSEMEALSSLAGYSWEHPADPFPRFAGPDAACANPLFDGSDLGHPLLPDEQCVRNSVTLVSPLRLLIVSGSNMSGKSTLLRSVGVNTVLALAGGPVRAGRLVLSQLSLGASIRTTDSLEEGQSRFMAEILRLKQVLELPAPALFLLDELLGGTNSHDRALGSEGVIRALLDRGAIGLVTTHDLSLARVADDLAPVAANVHFEDRLENDKLVFDYRMRAGVVTRSNALDLMRAVGLKV